MKKKFMESKPNTTLVVPILL